MEPSISSVTSSSSSSSGSILSKAFHGIKITNWAETFDCTPEYYFIPETMQELREILIHARASNKKVKILGCGHSPSDIAFTNDYLVSMKYFNRIHSINEDTRLVKVETGITLASLQSQLQERNLSLPTMGSVSQVTLGGVISTATHGSGCKVKVFPAYIREVELLTSSGDLVKCDSNVLSDVFYASLCGLGSLGILVTVTIECDYAFRLHQILTPSTLDNVLEDLNDHLENSDHFRFLWFPHTDLVSLSHITRVPVDVPCTQLSIVQKITSWVINYGIGYYTLELAYWVSSYFPSLVPLINRVWFYLQYSRTIEKIGKPHNIFNFECLFKQHVYEWSIPREKTQVVLSELRRFLDSRPDIRAHFPVEVRFTAADDIYLSPSFGRDSCYINIISYRPYSKEIPYREWWDAYEKIVKEAGGRPHWAKAHAITAADFVKMYPYFRAWAQVRKRLDPINMFTNDYMKRILATFPKDST